MFAVTGANGHLGRLVVSGLLTRIAAENIVALARRQEQLADRAMQGVIVRKADYNDPASLDGVFTGVKRLLLISGSEIGMRETQHQAVIDAAKAAGVGFIAYTSVLRADTSPLAVAAEHKATEAMLRASGIPHALLRNSWYTESYVASVPQALADGAFVGAWGNERMTPATRADLAAAAAVVLSGGKEHDGQVYELAGDDGFTMAEFADEVTRLSARPVAYNFLSEEAHARLLEERGLPPMIAGLIANSTAAAAQGALYDDSHMLRRLIGRPTQDWRTMLAASL